MCRTVVVVLEETTSSRPADQSTQMGLCFSSRRYSAQCIQYTILRAAVLFSYFCKLCQVLVVNKLG